MIHRAITLVAMLSLTASAAMSEESGQATLTIDGTDRAFTLDTGQSDWSGDLNYASVSIWLRPVDRAAGYDSVSLSFEYGRAQPESEELRLSKDGVRLYGNENQEDGGVSVSIEDISLDGNTLVVSGKVEGRAGTSETYGRDIDLSAAVPVSGRFDVRLDSL